jgi:hypothetical protein
MTLHRTSRRLMLGSITFFFICAAYAEESSLQPKQSIAPLEAKTLYSVNTDDGHVIVFQELSSGMNAVTETGKAFQVPRISYASGMSMADIYRTIQPKGSVPSALVAADARLTALKLKQKTAPVPPPPDVNGTGPGPGPRLYNAGEQLWFKETFCHDTFGQLSIVWCLQGLDWVTTQWYAGAKFVTHALVGSEGAPATYNTYYWNGSEVLATSITVPPGSWAWSTITYFQPFYARATLGNAGNAQVSLDVESCGNGGQWACGTNCLGCDPQRAGSCTIVGGHGESQCAPLGR